MKPIGTFVPENPFFLAPMEAVNCTSFRVLCRKRGASLVFTDMIDADVFMQYVKEHSEQEAIDKYLNPQPEEYPLAIQLGGAKIQTLKETIRILQPFAQLIDLNVGCPLGYMLGKKGGVYLMKHSEQLIKLVSEMRKEITIPFTVKIRAGWDKQSINAVEVAQELEKIGVDAITIHPRTRVQRYQDKADWQLARKVSDALTIPVILSGDVTNAYMAHMAFAHTKCDYIMCGRGAKQNPSIFTELARYWETKSQPAKPKQTYNKTRKSAQADFTEFLSLYTQLEKRFAFSEIKDHALWTARGCSENKEMTQLIIDSQSVDELQAVFDVIQFE